jgi:hypothetical protein
MQIVHTKDIDALFFPKLDEMAAELEANAEDFLRVWYSESGMFASAHNDNPKNLPPEKRWNASGIFQLMPQFMPGVGWTAGHAAYRQLSATQQLLYACRYYGRHKGLLGSVGAIYTATFLPALLKHAGDPAFVLTADPNPKTKGEPGEVLGWAYGPNAGFDANGDYAITVGELEAAVQRACRGPRWDELMLRLRGEAEDTSSEFETDDMDLRTTLGLQRALSRLGYDPGKADGIPGPRTRAALVAFQTDYAPPLVVDGIYGPKTREQLELALQTTA